MRFPIYIPSKGRADNALTMGYLDEMGLAYTVIVEAQEYDAYACRYPADRLLVLDPAYQARYETCDDLGDTKGRGPGPARNFAWDHAIARGFDWHWVMDDNIRGFYRMNRNLKVPVSDGTIFRCMEDFALRYRNLAMVGPNYEMFAPRKYKVPPFVMNTRIFSCNFIRNDIPFRWRGRYNEDTDLSLRVLKAGWCTVQFNAFLQDKVPTQTMKGGNNAEFYEREGTVPKSRMLVRLHPDVARMLWRFGRWHHYVDYKPFASNRLVLREGVELPQGTDNYGMALRYLVDKPKRRYRNGRASQV
ncbi:hypothetical protein AB4Y36_38125 [Paraburkholderia sp. BR10936]|uniref:GREB1-related protein n=1 Tax=Paraburkholderia sp. BR10936 TaxID=3236993 RepID=UPI0034D1D708